MYSPPKVESEDVEKVEKSLPPNALEPSHALAMCCQTLVSSLEGQPCEITTKADGSQWPQFERQSCEM